MNSVWTVTTTYDDFMGTGEWDNGYFPDALTAASTLGEQYYEIVPLGNDVPLEDGMTYVIERAVNEAVNTDLTLDNLYDKLSWMSAEREHTKALRQLEWDYHQWNYLNILRSGDIPKRIQHSIAREYGGYRTSYPPDWTLPQEYLDQAIERAVINQPIYEAHLASICKILGLDLARVLNTGVDNL